MALLHIKKDKAQYTVLSPSSRFNSFLIAITLAWFIYIYGAGWVTFAMSSMTRQMSQPNVSTNKYDLLHVINVCIHVYVMLHVHKLLTIKVIPNLDK